MTPPFPLHALFTQDPINQLIIEYGLDFPRDVFTENIPLAAYNKISPSTHPILKTYYNQIALLVIEQCFDTLKEIFKIKSVTSLEEKETKSLLEERERIMQLGKPLDIATEETLQLRLRKFARLEVHNEKGTPVKALPKFPFRFAYYLLPWADKETLATALSEWNLRFQALIKRAPLHHSLRKEEIALDLEGGAISLKELLTLRDRALGSRVHEKALSPRAPHRRDISRRLSIGESTPSSLKRRVSAKIPMPIEPKTTCCTKIHNLFRLICCRQICCCSPCKRPRATLIAVAPAPLPIIVSSPTYGPAPTPREPI